LQTLSAPAYQISAQLGNARLNYTDLTICNLGTVRHLGFDQEWTITTYNSAASETHNTPTYQILAKWDNLVELVRLNHFQIGHCLSTQI